MKIYERKQAHATMVKVTCIKIYKSSRVWIL